MPQDNVGVVVFISPIDLGTLSKECLHILNTSIRACVVQRTQAESAMGAYVLGNSDRRQSSVSNRVIWDIF
jgi:hypothetical protein